MKCLKILILAFIMLWCLIFLKSAEASQLECVFYLLKKAWEKADAGNVSIVYTAMTQLIVVAPYETLNWLSENSQIQEGLFQNWQYTVFTDFDGTRKGKLEDLKKNLIDTLAQYRCEGGRVNDLKRRMLNDLAIMKVREIN